MRALALLLILLAGACSTQWVRSSGAAAVGADVDELDCRRQAANEASLHPAGFYSSLGHYYGPNFQPYGRSRWLGAPGPMFDAVGDPKLHEWRLAEACMRAKGYELAPAKK